MSLPKGQYYSDRIDAVGYHDLERRPGFKMAMHRAGDRWYLYLAHFWHHGWTVLDVTDAASPRFVRFIAGPTNSWTNQVQVADGLMIVALEAALQMPNAAKGVYDQWGPPNPGPSDWPADVNEGVLIYGLDDPEDPKLLGHFRTGGAGTHRNFYAGGRYMHLTGVPEGFLGHIHQIVDIADPTQPKEVGRWWLPGQWAAGGETGHRFGAILHGGAYVRGERGYLPYSAGGFVILDMADVTRPRMISRMPFSPPFLDFIGVHTAVPLTGKPIVVLNSEAIAENGEEPMCFAGLVDISDEENPALLSQLPWPNPPKDAPWPSFAARGGRFGPHNQHQHQDQPALWRNEDHVFLTWFNAGLRIYDIREPRHPREVAWFLPPDPRERLGPMPASKLVAQTEDVLVDARGNIFVTDKNQGVFVLRWRDMPAA
ncbi:MAG: LVIVD repeat-containing protein [Alphaproteobacteria bacterium]